MAKPQKPRQPLKARLVSDFRIVNKKLKRPNWPLEGSSSLLKRLNRNHKFFCTLDFSSGYHQCRLDPEDRDIFSILLPQGKFRYARWPQGASPSSDAFLILSDKDLRNRAWCFKNMDDLLISASTGDILERRIEYVLKVCEKKNAKLSPSKFKISNNVSFGGHQISYSNKTNSVLIQPESEKIQAIKNLEEPKNKS